MCALTRLTDPTKKNSHVWKQDVGAAARKTWQVKEKKTNMVIAWKLPCMRKLVSRGTIIIIQASKCLAESITYSLIKIYLASSVTHFI